ncbi:MAG: hypothetical protein ISS18_00730 [Bacteroidales bacterium]|nr:hypothetical protein [Bacteroidales bacterium]
MYSYRNILIFIFKIVFLTLIIRFPNNLFAQNEKNILEDFVSGIKILDGGTYIINKNVKITKGGSLIIKSGTEILFGVGTSVIVEGALNIQGSSDNFVTISSVDKSNEGFGFDITGVNESNINISYAKFSNLIIPLIFSRNWYRAKVTIENNIFENIRTGEAGIAINSPDILLAENVIDFSFSGNQYSSNSSNIFIYNLESNVIDLKFKYNVITGNIFKGYEIGGENITPVYSIYNSSGKKYKADISGNSIFNNFLVNDQDNTIITELNFGITGIGGKFSIPGNYFGNKSKEEILKTFDHFSNNNSSPFLDPDPYLAMPSDLTQCFIWKIYIENQEVDPNTIINKTDRQKIRLFFNKPIRKTQDDISIKYFYYDQASKIIRDFKREDIRFELSDNSKECTIYLTDSIFIKKGLGYFEIGGLIAPEGFTVPKIEIGRNSVYTEIEIQKRLALEKSLKIINLIQRKIDSLRNLPNITSDQDSLVFELARQLDYITELSFNVPVYDSLINEFSVQLDSMNSVIMTKNKIDDLSNRLDYLRVITVQNIKQQKMINQVSSQLDSLDVISNFDPQKTDSIINVLSLRLDELETYSMTEIFKPLKNTWEIGVLIGQTFYTGDLTGISFNSKYLYLAMGVFAKLNFNSSLAAKFNFNSGKTGYSKSEVGSFQSKILQFNLQAEWTFLSERNIINPSISTGISILHVNNINSINVDNVNSLQIGMPFCVALKIKTGKKWILGAELIIIKPFTDLIDGYEEGGNNDLFYIAGITISRLFR